MRARVRQGRERQGRESQRDVYLRVRQYGETWTKHERRYRRQYIYCREGKEYICSTYIPCLTTIRNTYNALNLRDILKQCRARLNKNIGSNIFILRVDQILQIMTGQGTRSHMVV